MIIALVAIGAGILIGAVVAARGHPSAIWPILAGCVMAALVLFAAYRTTWLRK